MSNLFKLIILVNFIFSLNVFADSLEKKIDEIESTWAQTYYSKKNDDEKKKVYENLISQTETLAAQFPKNAEPLIWKGILTSNIAGVVGPMDALSKVKQAQNYFTEAIKLNPDALNSSAYVNLAILYHKLPAWPASFGDDDKAKELFDKALSKNPDSMEANLYYGEFLEDNGKKQEAITFLKKAYSIKLRPNQKFVDEQLQQEAKLHLSKLGVNTSEYQQLLKSPPVITSESKKDGSN
jgi:tetratricopeptide (TPR) repeat protein